MNLLQKCVGAVVMASLLTAASLLNAGLPGQSYLRAFGSATMDSRFYEVPAALLRMGRGQSYMATIGVDGNIYVNGDDFRGISQIPGLEPGEVFVDLCLGGSAIAKTSTGRWLQWMTLQSGGSIPVPPPPQLPPGIEYRKFAPGNAVCLALTSDGSVLSWYNPSWGTPNPGLHGFDNVPPIPSGVDVLDIDAVGVAGAMLLSNGQILMWGDNTHGQCNVPPAPPWAPYVAVSVGRRHAAGLRSDGSIVCWGDNVSGQCNVPALPPGVTYTMVSAGSAFTLALRSDHEVEYWGTPTLGPIPPLGISASNPCLQVCAGNISCAIRRADGRVISWGMTSLLNQGIAARSDTNIDYRHIGGGAWHVLATTSDGRIEGAGSNHDGVAVLPPAHANDRFLMTAGGSRHSVALREDGQIIAWGDNGSGQCNVPPLPPGLRYTHVEASSWHNVALRSDGSAVAWGGNTRLQSMVPPLPAGMTYVDVKAAVFETVFLRSDNALLRTWYYSTMFPMAPPPVPPDLDIVAIACNENGRIGCILSNGDCLIWPWQSHLPPPLPPLPWGVYYVEIHGGYSVFGVRRSDGHAVQMGGQFKPLPPSVGSSYVQVHSTDDSSLYRLGPQTTYISYAPGCSGTRPTTQLIPRDTPKLGKTLEVTLLDLPENAAFMVFGFRSTAPSPLDTYGMPGCSSHVSMDGAYLLLGQNHKAKYRLPIPDSIGLLGLRFYNQAVVLDSAANGLGAVVSNAAEGVIGKP